MICCQTLGVLLYHSSLPEAVLLIYLLVYCLSSITRFPALAAVFLQKLREIVLSYSCPICIPIMLASTVDLQHVLIK